MASNRRRHHLAGVKTTSPARKDTATKTIESLIERPELANIVSEFDDPRMKLLVSMLVSPDFRQHSLASICERAGVTNRELHDFIRQSKNLEALIRVYLMLPDVAENTAIDANSYNENCWDCDGTGDRGKRKCSTCHGRGIVRIKGDAEARKLVFGMVGLTGQRGPLIAQQFNLGLSKDGYEPLEQLMRAADRAITAGSATVVESEDGEVPPLPPPEA